MPMATTMATAVATAVATGLAGQVATSSRPMVLAAARTPVNSAAAVVAAAVADWSPTVAEEPVAGLFGRLWARAASSTRPTPMAGRTGRAGRLNQAAVAATVVVLSVAGLLGGTPPFALPRAPPITSRAAPPRLSDAARHRPRTLTGRWVGGTPVPAQGPAGGGGDGNQLFTVLTNIIHWAKACWSCWLQPHSSPVDCATCGRSATRQRSTRPNAR